MDASLRADRHGKRNIGASLEPQHILGQEWFYVSRGQGLELSGNDKGQHLGFFFRVEAKGVDRQPRRGVCVWGGDATLRGAWFSRFIEGCCTLGGRSFPRVVVAPRFFALSAIYHHLCDLYVIACEYVCFCSSAP